MKIKPTLSIIIISYNTAKITQNCLHSVFKDKGLPDIPFEIIVIDNASADNSVTVLKKYLSASGRKNIKLIVNSKNLGFAKANNQGLKIAQGNYILFLNSDTLILHSSISQSLNWLSSHPEASTCTAQLLNPDKSIQASGGFFPNLINVFTWSVGLDDLPFVNKIVKPLHPHTPDFYTKDKFYLSDHQQDWVTAAFMLVRKSGLDQSGPFDPNYFMYAEEIELSYRLKQKNPPSQCWYLIGPQIIHLGGASAKNKADPIINEYRGILSFFKKHRHPIQYQIVKIMLNINACLRSLFYFLSGNKSSFKIYRQACFKL